MRARKRMKTRSCGYEEVENLHLLRLPHLVQDHILSFLTIREQLQVRLICKTTKSWVDRRSSRLAEHIPRSIVRNRGPNSFKIFRNLVIQHVMTKMHLEDDTLDVFDDPSMPKFLQQHADGLTSLRLKRYFICSNNGKQTTFFEAFPKLEYLELDEIWIANADDITTKVPETFRRLKVLKLGRVKVYNEPTYEAPENFTGMPNDRKKILRWHIWNLLDLCIHLDYLRVPISPKFLFDNAFDECFRLLNYIRIRTSGITPRGFRAKQHVMKCDINDFSCCTSSLEVLLIVGARMRIQFLNVNSKIFRRGSSFCIIGTPHHARFDYIFSFVSSSLVNRSFEHVQKLTFKASLIQNECIIGRDKGPALFPTLREFVIILDIGCDTNYPAALYSRQPNAVGVQPARNVCLPRADQMLLFFFPCDMPYKFVHTASIVFEDPVFENQKRMPPERLTSLVKIISCFPNLRNLTLGGWNCKRNTYFLLWHGFSQLQKLTLESCSTLNPSCFIDGNGNPNNPGNYRFLPELKLLELKGLDNMPGVADNTELKPQMSDALFKMRLMPFKYLSRTELHSRTAVWIRSNETSDPFSYIANTSIVTRSISKAIKRK